MEVKKLSIEEKLDKFMEALDKKSEEDAKHKAEFEKRMKYFEKHFGSFVNGNGEATEEYFYNSFENNKRDFFGQTYDKIMKQVKGNIQPDEYDILMINGKNVCIIECKFRAIEGDISKVLRKAETFRINMPEYADRIIYLGLASKSFNPKVTKECEENGIAIIKETGDTVIINHDHLKAY